MIGLTPCLRHALYSSTAPFITPWSVRPSAGCSNCAARAARASILQAPSSSEYSECTCRWAQEELLTGPLNARRRSGGASAAAPLFAPNPQAPDQRHAVLVRLGPEHGPRRPRGLGEGVLCPQAQALDRRRERLGHLQAARLLRRGRHRGGEPPAHDLATRETLALARRDRAGGGVSL